MTGVRWNSEGNKAVALVQAIFAGTVTDKVQTFKEFFDPKLGGKGAAIGEKYSYHTEKGYRNLNLNWRKLVKKIKAWETNLPDSSGKRKLITCAVVKTNNANY